ncbi:MAG: hypothetical protein NVSMB14_12420 [Isosphaeraceae bacterium]
MFPWENLARRLRREGWNVWHSTCRDACGRTHIVHIHRPGAEWQGFGPTLTDAFVEVARSARINHADPAHSSLSGPLNRIAS